ncbi:ribonuclease Z [Marinomonas shanghaiensis]|uniref:ribonuclease Z n=1 Tax=Marinomonas shanghaiensis TaxID=2202418 RepID=UPI000DBA67B3|nr:ribonuclease Z [Marinomonas shanghaiensis]
MNIVFLGTSSGVPTKTRNVTGIAVREERGSGWYLIDCGEGTQHQILHTNLSINALRAIFITHIHGDHCYGLPGLLASAAMNGRKEPLQIMAPSGVKEWIDATQQHTQLYLPFDIEFISTDDLPSVEFRKVRVETAVLSHRVPSYAYCFTEKDINPRLDIDKLKRDNIPKGPLWGQLQKRENVELNGKQIQCEDYLLCDKNPQKIIIAGDNDQPERLSQLSHGASVLVHEATYTKDIVTKTGNSYGHSDAERVATFAEQAKIPNLVLTHFSPRYQANPNVSPSIADIYHEAKAHYSGNLFLANDLDEYQLNKSHELTKR